MTTKDEQIKHVVSGLALGVLAHGVDEAAGRLVPVRTLPGFKQLHPCRQPKSVLSASAGWAVHFTAEGEDSVSMPVVGWLICEDGDGYPLVASSEGIGPVSDLDDQWKLLAPGEKPSPPSAGQAPPQ